MIQGKVAIIVLNWNGKEDTLECLKSVQKIDYPNFDVIVVDNGSSDDSVKAIQKEFPKVKVLQTGKNLGFAAGNNAGMRYALKHHADHILLLNNDTVVDRELIKELMDASAQFNHSGIFGAKIYYYNEPNTIWYAGGKQKYGAFHFIHVGIGSIDNGQKYNIIEETDYITGCALFVSKGVLERIGLLDENYFLIYEETDFCFRAKKSSIKSYVVPSAKVWHKVSRSFDGRFSPLYIYFLTRNRLLWAENHLKLNNLLRLYKRTIKELYTIFIPQSFFSREHLVKLKENGINASLSEIKISLKKDFSDPHKQAKLYAVRDYLFRRFGDCPPIIRGLVNSPYVSKAEETAKPRRQG